MGEAWLVKVIYTPSALIQIDKALGYIEERNPRGAQRVKLRIKGMVDILAQQPMAGHSTNRPGVRRMVVSPYPYAIFYRVREDAVIIQRLRHTARRPI